ncbi:ABC transporter substrate-binding protein [Carboxydochorda subterranea]|uniref:ABC transporter substrate-binding protein n=1 Tax=Carboxydichorda subterranea TaxID=3109565 RepID=A0ABZ1BV57_9FIRM|nr:ABC transporter substrate-binding protein [Limnochorda sp. L945t]WRP16574.1 ABC transporter substrate-binding protein [Limnochorda sp. L945t]
MQGFAGLRGPRSKGPAVLLLAAWLLAATAASAAAASTRVTVWFMASGGDFEQYTQKVVEQFESAHPGVDVQYQIIPWEGVDEKLATAVASGTNPDVMQMGNVRIAPLIDMGVLEDLTPYVMGSDLSKDVTRRQWEVSGGLRDGHYYAIPFIQATRPFFWNRALYKEAGLDPDRGPRTWDDWLQMASKTHDPRRGRSGVAMGANDNMQLSFLWFPQLLWSAGGEIFSADGKQAAFASEAGVQAARFMVDLSKFAQPGFLGMMTPEANELFYQGRAATTVLPSSNVVAIPKTYPDLDFGMAPPPVKKQPAALAGMDSLVMFKSAKDKKAAWDVVAYLSGAESQRMLGELFGFTPVRSSLVRSRPFADDPRWQAAFAVLEYVKALPMTAAWARIRPRLGEELHYALAGQKTPEKALQDAAGFAAETLRQSGK